MKRLKNWQRTLRAVTGTCCALLIFSGGAHAELYQQISAGHTLAQLASHFRLSASDLRTANNLKYGDNEPLPAMLLLVPDTPTAPRTQAQAQTKQTPSRPAPRPQPQASGTMTSTISYTVKSGDSWESIANSYTAQGYELTADQIRSLNPQVSALRPGTSLRLALVKRLAGDSASFAAVTSRGYDTAQIVPQPKPLYNPPTASAPKAPTRRGPTNLASRSSYGMERGLQTLRGSTVEVQPAPQSTATATSMARVVKVVKTGARIRRAPDPNGATLYVCPVGTQLAVTGQQGYWYSILMSDRSTGWLPAKYVEMQNQQVDMQTQVITGSQAAQMFGDDGLQKVDGKLVSNHPLINVALTWMGTPYRYGGESRNGVDCSSFVQQVFNNNGVKLPRTAALQSKVGAAVNTSDLQTGDRLYFSSSRTYIDHTGIYIGNGKFIHASGSRRGVVISDINEPFYQKIYVGARR